MKYVAPYGVTDPDQDYVNGNPAAGIEGSIPPAEAFTFPLRELTNAVDFSGLEPTETDLTQLTQAMRKQWVNWAIDAGSVNNLSCSIQPPMASYQQGMPLRVLVANTNTGAATINVNGLGTRQIRRPDGAQLVSGDLRAGGIANLVDDGAVFQLVNSLGAPAVSTTTNLIDIPYTGDVSVTPNVITAVYSPAITSLTEGKYLAVKVNNTNTGSVTMTVNALSSYPVLRQDGQALQDRDLIKFEIVLLVFHATYFQMVSMVPSQSIQKFTADLTLYVRLDGNDTAVGHDGSANDSAHAFRTVAGAITFIKKSFSIAGRNVTIQLGQPGSYSAFVIDQMTQGVIIVRGDPNNQDSYIIRESTLGTVVTVKEATVSLVGLQIRDNTGLKSGLFASRNSSVDVTNCSFAGASGNTGPTGSTRASIAVNATSEVSLFGTIKFMHSCNAAIEVNFGAFTCGAWATLIQMVGTPAYASAFCYCAAAGSCNFTPGFTTFSGSAIGPRYAANSNAIIQTHGGGATFLPGNQAGTVNTGAQYI